MIDHPETNASNEPEIQRDPEESQSNFDRLQKQLRDDSLAAKIVGVFSEPGDDTPADAMKKVISERLDELKKRYDEDEDQPD